MNTLSWKNALPEQLNLYRHVTSLLVAPIVITPFYFMGLIAGSEFLVYAVNKLYLALDMDFGNTSISTFGGSISLFNELNVASHVLNNDAITYNGTTTVINYFCNSILTKNNYFSRLTASTYTYIKFNGYRITN